MLVDNIEISQDFLCRGLLRKVYDMALKEYGKDISHTVLTYSNATSLYKKSLYEKAARLSGLHNICMITDADAAIHYQCFRESHSIGDIFVVCDIGGTTFNLSLKVYSENGYKDLIPPIMVNRLGGCSFTQKILDDMIKKSGNKYKRAVDQNKYQVIQEYERVAERAKLYLDNNSQFEHETVIDGEIIRYQLAREEYEVMISEYITTICKVIIYAIKRAGISAEDISSLIFIGGSAKTPCVKDKICELLQKELPNNDYPEMSACVGAAISVTDSIRQIRDYTLHEYKGSLQPGSYLNLGKYNEEAILWKVILVNEEGYLVVSDKVICFKAYNTMGNTTQQTLITWLNSSDNSVHYHIPPTKDTTWYNAYDKEKGFLAFFDEMSKKCIQRKVQINVPDLNELSQAEAYTMECYPTKAAVKSNENTFGEEYSQDTHCPYWIQVTSDLNIINSKGFYDSTPEHNGTIGVRPVMVLNRNIYAFSGEGTVERPYKIIC